MKIQAVLLILGLGGTSLLMAADEKNYEASISLGYVSTSGNTDSSTFNTEILYSYKQANWVHNAKFQGLGSQENSTARAERYFLEDKSDYNLDEEQYVYVKGSYTDDRFSGFKYQMALSGGYGRYFFNSDAFSLQGYGGMGYRQNDQEIAGTESEIIFTLGQNVAWEISGNSALTQSFITEIGDQLTVSRFEIGLVSNIIDRIATKISFQARNTSEVPAGRKKSDTLTSVSLVYEF